MMMLGADGPDDFDMAGDGMADGGGFGLLSMLSIVSFMMGVGWMGLACRLEWGLGSAVSAFISVAFGFGLMFLTSLGMLQMRKLNSAGKYDVRHTIGRTGRVYLRIPPRGEGAGQVEIAVDGRRMVVDAVSPAGGIESFKSVKVTDVTDDGKLIVEEA
jgi:hypothetical protein